MVKQFTIKGYSLNSVRVNKPTVWEMIKMWLQGQIMPEKLYILRGAAIVDSVKNITAGDIFVVGVSQVIAFRILSVDLTNKTIDFISVKASPDKSPSVVGNCAVISRQHKGV